MLDRLTHTLLLRLNALGEGGYTILDDGELLALFPPKAGVDRKSAERMLFYLAEKKFVEIEYAEEGTYCVRPLPEGRLYTERERQNRRTGWKKRLEQAAFAALGGAAGGFLGTALAVAVFLF